MTATGTVCCTLPFPKTEDVYKRQVQVFAAALANALAVLPAQQLGIQTQDENRPHNVVQIGAVSQMCIRDSPLSVGGCTRAVASARTLFSATVVMRLVFWA